MGKIQPWQRGPGKEAADRTVAFFRGLRHTKGQYAGKPFILAPWQEKEIIRPLFGTLNPDGTRQFRTAYIEVPRKNGKSEIAAGIGLKLLLADGEPGAEIYGAASDREQAGIVFRVANQMVEQTPELRRRCQIYSSVKRIVALKTKSFYQVVSADAHRQHGWDGSGVIFDELHTQPNRELWDVATTSGGTRRQPLTFAITTAGWDRESICWEEHEYSRRVLEGTIEDPSRFVYIRSLAEDEDWTDEANWYRANPALFDPENPKRNPTGFRLIGEMRDAFKKAVENPAYQNTFRRLYLNQWTQQESRAVDLGVWNQAPEINPAMLVGRECWGGLDLASTSDLASLVLNFPLDQGLHAWLHWCWVPAANVLERSRKERAPYETWISQGHIRTTPGNVIDYDWIKAEIERLMKIYRIREIAYDPYGATQIALQLQGAGLPMVEHRQGYVSMAGPTKEFLALVTARKLAHLGNPVLRWMADNLMVKPDPAGNLKPDKGASKFKIDGIVAGIMAIGRAVCQPVQGPSVYGGRGILSV